VPIDDFLPAAKPMRVLGIFRACECWKTTNRQTGRSRRIVRQIEVIEKIWLGRQKTNETIPGGLIGLAEESQAALVGRRSF
jgi:hypothetical protein